MYREQAVRPLVQHRSRKIPVSEYLKTGTRVRLLEEFAGVYEAEPGAEGLIGDFRRDDLGYEFYWIRWDRSDSRVGKQVDGYVFTNHVEPTISDEEAIDRLYDAVLKTIDSMRGSASITYEGSRDRAAQTLKDSEGFVIVTLKDDKLTMMVDGQDQESILKLGPGLGEIVQLYLSSISMGAVGLLKHYKETKDDDDVDET